MRPPDAGDVISRKYFDFKRNFFPKTSRRSTFRGFLESLGWCYLLPGYIPLLDAFTRGAPASLVGCSHARPRDMQWHGCTRPLCTPLKGSAALLLLFFMIIMPRINLSSSLGIIRHVDLIESLQLWNTSYDGLTVIPGPRPIAPAVFLQGDNRDVRLPHRVQKAAESLLAGSKEFTFMATLQQEERNAGTIFAFSKGFQRFLELQSSGRKDEIRLHYIYEGAVHIEVFPFRLADQEWHKISVSISGSQVELWIDCRRIYRRAAPPPLTNFTQLSSMEISYDQQDAPNQTSSALTEGSSTMTLFLGQRNPSHFLFKGALQDVRVVEGSSGHLLQCPQAEVQCPTCGGFEKLVEQVAELQELVMQLSHKITSTEARLAAIEECDCQKSCKVNETIRQDGASWKIGCEICSCRHGEVTCRPVPCPNLSCKNPVYTEGECCPLCLKQCSLKGVVYDHGERVSPRQCVDCECRDGKMQCRRIDPETACPELPCPLSEQFSVPGQCCKFCSGIDYCSKGHSCHQNASCINLQTTYACHCNQGFTGDGYNCQDIDECQAIGAHHGHYCQAHTQCINNIGSYECICDDGFVRYDDYSCLEHNECKAGLHGCHENSYCVNTRGSYICVCKEGYQGNGTMCKPVCKAPCRNGGICTEPDVCNCRLGYTGESCEIDVDECSLELHRCPKNSVCINLPGWYMCQCGQGYSSLLSHNSDSKFCQDIDECKLGTSTCHKTATCVNTEGSFECHCENSTNCSLNCMSEGKERENGDVWAPENAKCSQCLCSNGKVSCDRFICDCTSPHVDPICCPQCNQNSFCHHPSYPGRTYASGQKWIHQCETCECFHGEIDCWPMECPPITCSHPTRTHGDCCPRCQEDPCSSSHNNNNSTLLTDTPQPCHYFAQSMQWSALIEGHQGHNCQMLYCSELINRGGAGNVLR